MRVEIGNCSDDLRLVDNISWLPREWEVSLPKERKTLLENRSEAGFEGIKHCESGVSFIFLKTMDIKFRRRGLFDKFTVCLS